LLTSSPNYDAVKVSADGGRFGIYTNKVKVLYLKYLAASSSILTEFSPLTIIQQNSFSIIKVGVILMGSILVKFGFLRQLLFKSTIDDTINSIEGEWNRFVSLLSEFETKFLQATTYTDSEWHKRAQTVKGNLSKINPYIPQMTNLIRALKSNVSKAKARDPNYIQAVSKFIQALELVVVNPIESIQEVARVGQARVVNQPLPRKSIEAAQIDTEIDGTFKSILYSAENLKELADSYLREIRKQPQPQQEPTQHPTQSPARAKANPIPILNIEGATAGSFIGDTIRAVRRIIESLEGNAPKHPQLPFVRGVFQTLLGVARQIRLYEDGDIPQPDWTQILNGLDNLKGNLEKLSEEFRKYPGTKAWGETMAIQAKNISVIKMSVENFIRGMKEIRSPAS
jgi:hypothetical protein